MEWTTERRYRRYEDWSNDEIKQIKEKMAQSPWHTHYHVEPKMGLLNDPNGLSLIHISEARIPSTLLPHR